MIGFTKNETELKVDDSERVDDEVDFDAFRAERLTLRSVEVRDAFDDYNRANRNF